MPHQVINPDFAHLHVHTEYSLLDGLSHIKQLVQQTKELGMNHLAITDHGAMYGVIEFYKICQAGGIHPLIGCEAYLTDDLHDRSKRYSDDYSHLLLIARNDTGYRNLMQLTTIANTEGYHLRPRIDKQALEKHAEGLIVTSGCLSAEIPKLLLAEKQQEAYQTARWYQDVFGPENVYLEIQEHHGVWENLAPSPQARLNQLLYRMHKELDIPLVATNDLHYIRAEDAHTHDVLLCVQTKKPLSAEKRFKFDSREYYLKSPAEMRRLFPELPDALANTVYLAERCEVNPLARTICLPRVEIPPPYTSAEEYLYALCLEGATHRFGVISEPVRQRLDYEYRIIAQKGYATYFLIVVDYVRYARSRGILCAARGSAAGSLLAYVLGITNVDPLHYQLLFERFMNPERNDMPDIDMDFPDDRRDEVIYYVAKKYGYECVAQMVTFNTMAAKQSVKDVARAMGMSHIANDIVPFLTPSNASLREVLGKKVELQRLYQTQPQVHAIYDRALALEHTVRATGAHAAGVILSEQPLRNLVPLEWRDPKKPGKGLKTQFEHKHLEAMGATKFDFLSLANLTTIQRSCDMIWQTRGERIDVEQIPLEPTGRRLDDERLERAFALLREGQTAGLFMVEGAKMTDVVRRCQPDSIRDLASIIALYRPGPLESIPDYIEAKHGRKQVTYLDPRLKEWLEETYGVIVYQDQVLLIAVNLAGFTWGKVNNLRKALSKKIKHEVEAYKQDFIQGCVHNGMSPSVATDLFELIRPFAGYGFNKAHAISFAILTFITAYLKANFTAEYLAAMMSTTGLDSSRKLRKAITESKRMNVRTLGPDINRSSRGFTVEEGAIRFGLLAIKGLGEGPVYDILQAREREGPFRSLADVCRRCTLLTKGHLEALTKAGALDALANGQRHHLLASIDQALSFGKAEREAKERGLLSLFDGMDDEPALAFHLVTHSDPIPQTIQLQWEYEFLGLYLTQHPLANLQSLLASSQPSHNIEQLEADLEGSQVIISGMLMHVERKSTRNGAEMCKAQIEDLSGSIEVIVFPQLYRQSQQFWKEHALLQVTGTLQINQFEEPEIICSKVHFIHREAVPPTHERRQVWITIQAQAARANMQCIREVHRILQAHPGRDQYEILVSHNEWVARLRPQANTVAFSPRLQLELEEVLGKGSVHTKTLH